MALNSLISNTDFVQKTAESRKIIKALVGDFTFDLCNSRRRHKVFLSRNMTKVLAFHDRNRIRGVETGTFRSSSFRTRGPFLGQSVPSPKTGVDEITAQSVESRSNTRVNGNDASHGQDRTTARPDIEAMSQDCLKVKAMNGNKETRRSARNQLARQHEDKNAQLYFDLINIRKKLNFKENIIEGDDRPRKRVRRESINCHCHITIWDNREGLDQKEPIIRKSEMCEVLTTDLGTPGYLAEIKLQRPFIFKSSELKVPLESPRGSVLGVGDNYFLEIKIIPTRSDVDWPPVPVLGRSEGDQTTGLGRMAAEKLQGALVVRYLRLPQAPSSDTPLSVFFLHEGRTYRSKYGLEVNAVWSSGGVPEVMVKHEEDTVQLDLWAVGEDKSILTIADSSPSKDEERTPISKTRNKPPPKPPSSIKVTFNIDATSAKGAKDFRKSSTMGLQCPACPKQKFQVVDDLLFHFATFHPRYKFTIEKQEKDPLTNDLVSIVFKMTAVLTTKPRNQEREPQKSDGDFNWQAPAEPLDVPAYLSGDQNWVEHNWVDANSKKPEVAPATIKVVPDKLSDVRQSKHGGFLPAQKGGFLPAEYVSNFRQPCRKKYNNIRLKTMTTDKETMYTSVSHRKVHVGEEARSESDDEMEDGWFVQKSLEALDIAAEKQEWNNEQRLLRRKWNQARLSEKLSHPRYLSDCLIRFVRSEKVWLGGENLDRKTAFAEFLNELLQRRVINQEVVRDIWTIIHDEEGSTSVDKSATETDTRTKATETPQNDRASARWTQNLSLRARRAEDMLRLAPYTCAVCIEAIDDLRRNGLRCSEHDCEAPSVWYHAKCVRCKRKDKLSWKCDLCAERSEELKKAKGKEVAHDYETH